MEHKKRRLKACGGCRNSICGGKDEVFRGRVAQSIEPLNPTGPCKKNYTVQYSVLYCTAVYCTALHYTGPDCTRLHCTVVYCTCISVSYCVVLYCTCRWSRSCMTLLRTRHLEHAHGDEGGHGDGGT